MTAATEDGRARARELRRRAIANNPDRLCPPDHKHGETSTCFTGHGCLCDDCRVSRARVKRAEYYAARMITGQEVKVPAVGVMRRLQALAFMGWSCEAIAQRVGTHYRPLVRLRAGGRENVLRSTHDRVDAVFEELCLVRAPGHSGRVTRGVARAKGWVSALAWEHIDDPEEQPAGVGGGDRKSVDRELVLWLHNEGLSAREIADRAGCAERTVDRLRKEMGLAA